MDNHSFSRIAFSAAAQGWEVVALAEAPEQGGCLPHGWAVLHREPVFAGHEYLVSMYCLEEQGEGAFFGSSVYDLDREGAFACWSRKVERDCAPPREQFA